MTETRIRAILIVLVSAAFFLAVGMVNATAACQTWSTPNVKVIGVTWGNSTHFISAAPGDKDIPLTVTLETFDTTCAFENMVGSFELYGGVTDYSGAATSTYYIQSVQPPSILNMVFYLNIAGNVTMGPDVTATYPLVLEWDSNNGTINVKQQLNVEVPLDGAANLSFTVKKPAITIGKVTEVNITVSNSGSGIASDIGTTASSSQGVSFFSQPGEITSLAPGESKNISLSLYVAPSQSGNSQAGASVILNLDTHYISPYGHNTTMSNQLGLFASSPSQSSVLVSASNQTLVSGVISDMNLTVSNSGSDPITNLSVVLTPESPLSVIGPDNLNTVQEVLPGTDVNLPISLYVQSTTSAVSTLDISLSYLEDNQQVTTSRSISFLNPGNINLTLVSTVVSPSVPEPGQIFSITSTMNNVGAQSATAAQVTASPPTGIAVLGSATTFIGDIPVSSPAAFTVSFTVSPKARPGNYTIPVVLSYMNNLNQQRNKTFEYVVSIGSGLTGTAGNGVRTITRNGTQLEVVRNGRGSGFPYLETTAIVVIIGIAAYYLYRRGVKKREKARR